MSRDSGNATVAGNQGRVESLCQRKVGRVVGARIGAKLPDTRDQHVVRIASEHEVPQVLEGFVGTSRGHAAVSSPTSQGAHDLDVDEMRSVECLTWKPYSLADPLSARGAEEKLHGRRSVEHDHPEPGSRPAEPSEGCLAPSDSDSRSSRAACTASAADSPGSTGVRDAIRERNASSVGRSATRRSSSSTYSDNDLPARAARAFSVLCGDLNVGDCLPLGAGDPPVRATPAGPHLVPPRTIPPEDD